MDSQGICEVPLLCRHRKENGALRRLLGWWLQAPWPERTPQGKPCAQGAQGRGEEGKGVKMKSSKYCTISLTCGI